MHLISVYEDVYFSKLTLWRLLQERKAEVNISHKAMPEWEEHCRFVDSKPYKDWLLIIVNGEAIGAIYVSKMDEIGIFIFNQEQGKGYGRAAIKLLGERYKGRLLANVAPGNYKSKALFISLGFKPIQETFAIEAGEKLR